MNNDFLYERLAEHLGHRVCITEHRGEMYLECEDCDMIVIDTCMTEDEKEN